MIADLQKSIIFLHGLSGSGKGEIQRKLTELYSSRGYEAIYISSGALFRAALLNPIIAEQVRGGYFLDTLGAIMPGIENTFKHFVQRWVESDGKAILIIDGVIRRGTFTNKEGIQIPSQIEQISLAMHEAIKKIITENKTVTELFPEYAHPREENELIQIAGVKQLLTGATHIVADVLPDDAEAQMKRRADKEILSIKTQLHNKFFEQPDADRMLAVEKYLYRLEAILHGGIKKGDGGLIYTDRMDWNDITDGDVYELAAIEVKQIRESLAQSVGLESTSPLTASLESIGIFTDLRDDDISPVGRRTRINNYIKSEDKGETHSYEAGFATQALCDDLGFNFSSDGSFHSEAKNCIVLANGKSRGIGLAQFQNSCENIATVLYRDTESQRELINLRSEGQRINRELE